MSPGTRKSLLSHINRLIGPVGTQISVHQIHERNIIAHYPNRREQPNSGNFLDRIGPMIFQQSRNELFMGSLNDVQIAISIHKKQEGNLAVDFGYVALKDRFREDRLLAGIESNLVDQLIVAYSPAKFDDVQMPGIVLFCAIGRKIDICEVGE